MVRSEQFDIICLSDAPFSYPLWTNKQHIMSRLAERGYRVLYVDPQLGFIGWLKWLLERRLRFSDLFLWVKRRNTNLWVFSPILMPPRYKWGRRVNDWVRLRGTKILSHRLGFKSPLLWIYHPDAVYFAQRIKNSFVIYDCVDEYSTFPAYSAPARKAQIQANEARLLKIADLVFTTSRPLYELKKQSNPQTYLVENVADAEHFGKALLEETAISSEMAELSKPIIGFVGALDAYKVDFELIKYLALSRPEWSFVLIGPIGEGDRQTRVDSLQKITNIHFLGPKQYSQLPNYVKGFDVCIIPYQVNQYTYYSFPLKVYEFLASGKPVVTTNLPSIKHLSGVLKIASDYQEFLQFLSQAVEEDDSKDRARRIEVARQNSWDYRVEKILEIIKSTNSPFSQ